MPKQIVALEITGPGIFNPHTATVELSIREQHDAAVQALLHEGPDTAVCVGWQGRFGLSLSATDRAALLAGELPNNGYGKVAFPVYPYLRPSTVQGLAFDEAQRAIEEAKVRKIPAPAPARRVERGGMSM